MNNCDKNALNTYSHVYTNTVTRYIILNQSDLLKTNNSVMNFFLALNKIEIQLSTKKVNIFFSIFIKNIINNQILIFFVSVNMFKNMNSDL